MRDWKQYVRDSLTLPDLEGLRDERIVEELAGQLQDLYETALSNGSTESEAEQYALDEFPDWSELAGSIAAAERPNLRPSGDRL